MRRKKSIPRSPVRGGNFNLDVSHPDFLAGFGGSETEAQAAIAMPWLKAWLCRERVSCRSPSPGIPTVPGRCPPFALRRVAADFAGRWPSAC